MTLLNVNSGVVEALYLLRRLIEIYRRNQKNLHMIFIDLEKTYSKVAREIFLNAREKEGVYIDYIKSQHYAPTCLHWSWMCSLNISKNQCHNESSLETIIQDDMEIDGDVN
ncbi:hypothetical protein Lal_00044073 [Lupinus albus]|nr:hypothetical protein Lal_00044073 [Lupinus albus]